MRTYRHDATNSEIAVYNSIGELTDHVKANVDDRGRSGWEGESIPRVIKGIHDGLDERETRAAKELLDKINTQFTDTQRYARRLTVSGQRVHMGKYVSGNPNCMVKRKRLTDEIAPIKLVAEVTVSAGVDNYTLVRRGTAIAALMYALGKVRPVEIHAMWGLGKSGPSGAHMGMVKIPTTPLSLSQMLAVFTMQGFARRFTFGEVRSRGCIVGSWALGSPPESAGRVERVRDALGLKPDDIFIPGGFLTQASLMVNNPLQWVENQVAAHR